MIFLFAWKKKYRVFDVSDPIVTIIPLALGLGRIGNLINRELLGYFPYT
jgi:prolipoprotein diacylglyceryltransferase